MRAVQPIAKNRASPANGNGELPTFTSLALLEKFQPQQGMGKERAAALDANRMMMVGFIEARFQKALNHNYKPYGNEKYSVCLDAIRRTHFDAQAIEDFSLHGLVKYEDHFNYDEIAGYFLSALVGYSCSDKCTLRLPESAKRIDHIGYGLYKELTVHGSVGNSAGIGMEMGRLEIFGDAGTDLGFRMKGGKIILRGSAGEGPGKEMNDGLMVIFGNAGVYAGDDMYGGQLVVYGNCGDRAGSSMNKGKLIIRKNCGQHLGEKARGGEIFVVGNAGDCAGEDIDGSKIKIYGNAGRCLGSGMHKGEIIVFGDAGPGAGMLMEGGTIRVSGKLILHKSLKGGDIFQGEAQLVRCGLVIRRPNNY